MIKLQMFAFQQFPKNFTCYDFSVPIMLDYAPRLTILLQTFLISVIQ